MVLVTFFLSYRWELTIPASLLWTVSWKTDRFDPQSLKKTHLIFLCDTAWPWYPLEDGEWWPVGGSLKYNTVLQLNRFCKEQGKWVEVAYVLPFFSRQNMPDLCPNGEGNGNSLQYSCLENSMDWEAPQSLVGYSPWGRKESDTTEQLHLLA